MSKQGGLSDTKRLPKPPEEHPHGRAQSPHTAIRRASMTGGTRKQMPTRRPPQKNGTQPSGGKKKTSGNRTPARAGKHGVLFRITVVIAAILLTVFCAYSAVAIVAINRIRDDKPAERRLESDAPESDPKVQNILLIGTDARGDERGRADTILLLSVSGRNNTVTQTSILRDCYVSIPDHGTDRLNAAYAYGGGQLLADTIVNNFEIPVDDYICFGFSAMIALTDALGGVDITLSEQEATAVNRMLGGEINDLLGDPVDADYLPGGGSYRLSGKQALCYSRIRSVGNADFERTDRQRLVWNRLLDRAKKMTPSAAVKILRDVCPELTTNISGGRLYLAALKAPYVMLRYDTQELRLPEDGSYSDQVTQDGAQVLAVDFEKNRDAYRRAVTEKQ